MRAGMRRKRRRKRRRRRNRWRRMPTTTNEELLDEGGAVHALVSRQLTWVQEPIADGTWSDIGCEKMEGWGLGL
jgi:hypothetical protein